MKDNVKEIKMFQINTKSKQTCEPYWTNELSKLWKDMNVAGKNDSKI